MRIHSVRILVTCVAVAVVAPRTSAQAPAATSHRTVLDSAARASLLAARDRIWRAWFANDSVELGRLLPPAVVAVEGEDGWEDRAAILSGSKQFAASGGRFVAIRFFDTEIVSYGTIAIVHARYELALARDGRRSTSTGHATEIFVRRDGAWVNPFWRLEP
jgi:hypothetical protein